MTTRSVNWRALFKHLPTELVLYSKATGQTKDDLGNRIDVFASPVVIRAAFRPVPRETFERLGLQMQKDHFTVSAPLEFTDLGRGTGGDRLIARGGYWQVISLETFWEYDDARIVWSRATVVKIGNTSIANTDFKRLLQAVKQPIFA